jgi:hypothetical protein
MTSTRKLGYFVVGYQPREGIPSEDYKDFPIGMELNFEEIRYGIYGGTFPPGLIILAPGGQACVVKGHYGNEEFKSLSETLEGMLGKDENNKVTRQNFRIQNR